MTSKPEIRLAVNNAFAVKRWPEPSAWVHLIAKDLGIREIQFSFDLLDPGLPTPVRTACVEEIRQATGLAGVRIGSTFTGAIAYAHSLLAHPSDQLGSHALAWYESALHVTAQLGAESCGGYMGAISLRECADEARRQAGLEGLIQSVRRLRRLSAELGLQAVLWELMPSDLEPPHTPSETEQILQTANEGIGVPVWLCFDLGHCCASDLPEPGEPEVWLERLLSWTQMVHLQQTDGRDDHHWPFAERYAGRGIINPRRIVELVRESPLDQVDLVFEFVYGPTVKPQTIIDDHKRSIEEWWCWL